MVDQFCDSELISTMSVTFHATKEATRGMKPQGPKKYGSRLWGFLDKGIKYASCRLFQEG